MILSYEKIGGVCYKTFDENENFFNTFVCRDANTTTYYK